MPEAPELQHIHVDKYEKKVYIIQKSDGATAPCKAPFVAGWTFVAR